MDPKVVDPVHRAELLALMAAAPGRPVDSFVAKGYCTDQGWARQARAAGYRTWGYYYGRDVGSGATPFAATQADWTLLGLDLAAPDDAWGEVRALGKPLIGHIADGADQARRLLADGAQGVMVAGIRSVLAS